MATFHAERGQEATKQLAKMKEFLAFVLTSARSGASSCH